MPSSPADRCTRCAFALSATGSAKARDSPFFDAAYVELDGASRAPPPTTQRNNSSPNRNLLFLFQHAEEGQEGGEDEDGGKKSGQEDILVGQEGFRAVAV